MNLAELIKGKQSEIITIGAGSTVVEAANSITRNKIGALLVKGEGGAIVGILSERDIVRGLSQHGADLHGVEEGVFAADLARTLRGFTTMRAPVIAAIDGPALGAGAQLAAVCDLRVATAESIIGVPAARLGLMLDHWTIERLTREFGWPVTRAMLLAAETYTGAQLHVSGGVHRLGGLDEALAWAGSVSRLAPLSIAGHKLALETSGGEPGDHAAVARARELAWASRDATEGRTAFLQKRPAVFVGE